jgi:hypothetical protein
MSKSSIEELRKTYEKMKSGSTKFIRLKDENKHVLMYYYDNNDKKHLHYEYHTHYIKDIRKFVPCIKDIGKNCPICDLQSILKEAGNKDADKFFALSRYLVNVYDVLEARSGVVEYNYSVYKDILSYITDEEYDENDIIYDSGGQIFKITKVQDKPLKYSVKLLEKFIDYDKHIEVNQLDKLVDYPKKSEVSDIIYPIYDTYGID